MQEWLPRCSIHTQELCFASLSPPWAPSPATLPMPRVAQPGQCDRRRPGCRRPPSSLPSLPSSCGASLAGCAPPPPLPHLAGPPEQSHPPGRLRGEGRRGPAPEGGGKFGIWDFGQNRNDVRQRCDSLNTKQNHICSEAQNESKANDDPRQHNTMKRDRYNMDTHAHHFVTNKTPEILWVSETGARPHSSEQHCTSHCPLSVH